MSQQLPFETEKYTFTVHYLDTDEKATYDDAADLKEALEQMSWEKHKWTPILQEDVEDGEFSLFVHSDTFDEEIFSQSGARAWELRGYDLNPYACFWELFQDEFNIVVDTKLVQEDEPVIAVQEYRVVTDSWFTELRYLDKPQQSEIEILIEAYEEYDSFLGGVTKLEFINEMASVEIMEHTGVNYKQSVNMTFEELKELNETPHVKLHVVQEILSIKQVVSDIELFNASPIISSPQDLANIAYPIIGELDREVMLVIMLNTKNRVIGIQKASTGSISSAIIHPREILKSSVLSNASAIALVHNHPSMNLQESFEDREVTKRLAEVAELIGIPLIDHLIVGPEKGKFNSLKAKDIF